MLVETFRLRLTVAYVYYTYLITIEYTIVYKVLNL